MKTLTPKQRREIYLKVFIRISKRGYNPIRYAQGLCYLVNKETGENDCSNIDRFDELSLFEPRDGEEYYSYMRWFEGGKIGVGERQICMLFCAEIAKDAKE